MGRKMSQISGVVVLSVVTLAVATDASAAQVTSPYLGGDKGQLLLRLGNVGRNVQSELVAPLAIHVTCNGSPENPHYSRGAGSVIFKTRITCHGEGVQVVQVRARGTLGSVFGEPPRGGSAPGGPAQGPLVTEATSDQTQNVAVNGPATTYYTPLEGPGSPKVRGSKWFQGDVTAEIVAPPPGVVTDGPSSASSNRVWVNDPR